MPERRVTLGINLSELRELRDTIAELRALGSGTVGGGGGAAGAGGGSGAAPSMGQLNTAREAVNSARAVAQTAAGGYDAPMLPVPPAAALQAQFATYGRAAYGYMGYQALGLYSQQAALTGGIYARAIYGGYLTPEAIEIQNLQYSLAMGQQIAGIGMTGAGAFMAQRAMAHYAGLAQAGAMAPGMAATRGLAAGAAWMGMC